MNTNDKNQPDQQGSNDKIHGFNLGEERAADNLSYDEEKNSFEIDVKSTDKDYDHPFPYDTSAANGGDFDSTYDEANPLVGDEYTRKDEQAETELDNLGMHVDDGDIVQLTPEDEYLAKTPEDDRPDLDEEGYPINNAPPMP